jgi:transcriptional regulator with GAF, ATPase, and Fis domain
MLGVKIEDRCRKLVPRVQEIRAELSSGRGNGTDPDATERLCRELERLEVDLLELGGRFQAEQLEPLMRLVDGAVRETHRAGVNRILKQIIRLLGERRSNTAPWRDVMDELIALTGSTVGCIVARGREGQGIIVVGRTFEKRDVAELHLLPSRKVIKTVLSTGKTLDVKEAYSHPELSQHTSIISDRLLALLAVPVRYENRTIGVIYLTSTQLCSLYGKDVRELVEEVAEAMAPAFAAIFDSEKDSSSAGEGLSKRALEVFRSVGIVGNSPALMKSLALATRAARGDGNVLVCGETGTGKELVARAIHLLSPRRHNPFVVVDCRCLNQQLAESLLFGHEKGAFTGAHTRQIGHLESANTGTIFLDEVADIPLNIQAKLLRCLQDHTVWRLGGTEPIRLDVRIIAATSHDLRQLVREGRFREDLYYRLHVIAIDLPPLRERGKDVFLLFDHFAEEFARQNGRKPIRFSDEVYGIIGSYPFPGNVHELYALVQWLCASYGEELITAAHIPEDVRIANFTSLDLEKNPYARFFKNMPQHKEGMQKALREMKEIHAAEVRKFRHRFAIQALALAGGKVSRAAGLTGYTRANFRKMLNGGNGRESS